MERKFDRREFFKITGTASLISPFVNILSQREQNTIPFKSIEGIKSIANDRKVPSGFKDFDYFIKGGFSPGELTLVAGDLSVGKTQFCLQIANHAAKRNIPVHLFSTELSKEQAALRLLWIETGISADFMRRSVLGREMWKKLIKATESLTKLPLFIHDGPMTSIETVEGITKRTRPGFLIVDYLQMMKTKSYYDRRERELSEISHSLKKLAMDLSIPIILVSRVDVDWHRRDKRPKVEDLRRYSFVEGNIDLLIFLYRDELYEPETLEKGRAEIIIPWNRHSPAGTVYLAYSGGLFKDLA